MIFNRRGYLDWRVNSTFSSLIPKEKGEKSINDYRRISLLFGIYKLIAKVLAIRFKSLLGVLVSDYQGATIKVRQLQDLGPIANELLDSRRAQKKVG